MSAYTSLNPHAESEDNATLFEAIAKNIEDKGYSIHPNALPLALADSLWQHLQTMPSHKFQEAGIGREVNHTRNNFVRTDEICWINGETAVGQRWLAWTNALQRFLNQRLFLGLFSFESHFAHYAPGDFYKKHMDAFNGEANRILSLVVYLNPDWLPNDGGELVMYTDPQSQQHTLKVIPGFGTIVLFLSEEFPHEVLAAKRDRYSIAGWFRVNTSHTDRVDPPR